MSNILHTSEDQLHTSEDQLVASKDTNTSDSTTKIVLPTVEYSVVNIRTEEEYKNLISGKDLPVNITHVVINFGAPWCTSCKRIKNEYENLVSQYPNIIFAKFNIDEMEDLAVNLGITMLPTFMFHHVKNQSIKFDKLLTSNMKEVIKKIDSVLLADLQISDEEDF